MFRPLKPEVSLQCRAHSPPTTGSPARPPQRKPRPVNRKSHTPTRCRKSRPSTTGSPSPQEHLRSRSAPPLAARHGRDVRGGEQGAGPGERTSHFRWRARHFRSRPRLFSSRPRPIRTRPRDPRPRSFHWRPRPLRTRPRPLWKPHPPQKPRPLRKANGK